MGDDTDASGQLPKNESEKKSTAKPPRRSFSPVQVLTRWIFRRQTRPSEPTTQLEPPLTPPKEHVETKSHSVKKHSDSGLLFFEKKPRDQQLFQSVCEKVRVLYSDSEHLEDKKEVGKQLIQLLLTCNNKQLVHFAERNLVFKHFCSESFLQKFWEDRIRQADQEVEPNVEPFEYVQAIVYQKEYIKTRKTLGKNTEGQQQRRILLERAAGHGGFKATSQMICEKLCDRDYVVLHLLELYRECLETSEIYGSVGFLMLFNFFDTLAKIISSQIALYEKGEYRDILKFHEKQSRILGFGSFYLATSLLKESENSIRNVCKDMRIKDESLDQALLGIYKIMRGIDKFNALDEVKDDIRNKYKMNKLMSQDILDQIEQEALQIKANNQEGFSVYRLSKAYVR